MLVISIELRHLRYFVAVAEERHFGRAAARLLMAQPPLSQSIRTLEHDLGVQLLTRTTRRVALTDAGTAYLLRAREILALIDAAGHEARQVAAGSIGRLAVGCVGSATYSLLPTLAQGLCAELPGIDFAFRGEMLVPDQIRALRLGDIDIALLRPPVADPTISVRVLRRERLVAALPATHPYAAQPQVALWDLREESFIVHSGRRDSVMFESVLGMCRASGFEPRIRHEVDETSTLVTLVAGGLGVAVVPEPVAALHLDGVVYRTLTDRGAMTALAVAHLTDRVEPHLLRAVAEIVRIVG
jgi:DNA-binding transcriptional LysR family regulator